MIRKTTLPIILVLMVASAVAIIGYSCSSKQTFSNVNSIIRIVPPITDQNILPTTQVFASYISNQISITASPGEFEPASFVVQANQNISSLQVQASNLTGTSGSIPSSNVDIRVVKVWYQSGVTVVHESKVLTPELLLKDDSLVKIENGENYLKVSGNYVWISGPDGIPGVYVAPKSADFPVQDSA
ncbi:MAG: hypothetical protein GY845_28885, partial [Planctomycetes bacterium]|nr:hypothetical protein [Planctomycetota bacterium]